MVVGKPIYENLEQGFDVRESLELNFDTIKYIVVSKNNIITLFFPFLNSSFQQVFSALIHLLFNGGEFTQPHRSEEDKTLTAARHLFVIRQNDNGYRCVI